MESYNCGHKKDSVLRSCMLKSLESIVILVAYLLTFAKREGVQRSI